MIENNTKWSSERWNWFIEPTQTVLGIFPWWLILEEDLACPVIAGSYEGLDGPDLP